ncbi:MAG: MFS transporter [Acidimicrobiales bacterium]
MRDDEGLTRVVRSGGFFRFLAARTISQWGDTFNGVAVVILVYRMTGSGLRVGGAVAFEIAPVLLFGFLAGAVVDHWPRRRVLVGADLGRAAIAAAVAVFHSQLWMLYAAAFGLSAFSVFFSPAASSVVPALVDKDRLVGANSALWSAAVLSQIVMAPVAGGLVALAGAGPAFGLNAASFLVSAGLLGRLGLPRRPPAPPGWHLGQIIEGLRVIRSSRFLSTLAAVQALAALSTGATSALLVVLAERHLHVGAEQFGLLLAAIGVGGGLGPLVLSRLVRDVGHPGWLFGPYLLRAAVDLLLATTANFGLALGALGLYGVGTSTGSVAYQSVVQTGVPDAVRGRVFAFLDVVWQTARLASIGLGGVLADAYGITAVYLLGGCLLGAAGLLGLMRAGDPPGRPAGVAS